MPETARSLLGRPKWPESPAEVHYLSRARVVASSRSLPESAPQKPSLSIDAWHAASYQKSPVTKLETVEGGQATPRGKFALREGTITLALLIDTQYLDRQLAD